MKKNSLAYRMGFFCALVTDMIFRGYEDLAYDLFEIFLTFKPVILIAHKIFVVT